MWYKAESSEQSMRIELTTEEELDQTNKKIYKILFEIMSYLS